MNRLVGALAVAVSIALSLAVACGGDVAHPDIPKAPKDQGTPIHVLVEASGELSLRPEQAASIKDIDTNLAGQLDIIDMRLKGLNAPHQHAGSGSGRQPPPAGFRASGMGGGRRRGMGPIAPQAGSGSSAPVKRSPQVAKLETERENDIRSAIRRALDVMDPTQRKAAIEILVDRGLDLLLPSDDGAGSVPPPTLPPPTLPPPSGSRPAPEPTSSPDDN